MWQVGTCRLHTFLIFEYLYYANRIVRTMMGNVLFMLYNAQFLIGDGGGWNTIAADRRRQEWSNDPILKRIQPAWPAHVRAEGGRQSWRGNLVSRRYVTPPHPPLTAWIEPPGRDRCACAGSEQPRVQVLGVALTYYKLQVMITSCHSHIFT